MFGTGRPACCLADNSIGPAGQHRYRKFVGKPFAQFSKKLPGRFGVGPVRPIDKQDSRRHGRLHPLYSEVVNGNGNRLTDSPDGHSQNVSAAPLRHHALAACERTALDADWFARRNHVFDLDRRITRNQLGDATQIFDEFRC